MSTPKSLRNPNDVFFEDGRHLQTILINHEQWLLSDGKAGEQANLEGMDLSYTDLRERTLSGAKMGGASLEGVDASRADFSGARLQKSIFRNAELQDTKFIGASISDADMTSSRMPNADLSDAWAKRTNFKDANMYGVTMHKTKAPQADFSSARMRFAGIVASDVTNSRFVGTNLAGASIQGTDVRGANFDGANVKGLTASAIRGAGMKLMPAVLRGGLQDIRGYLSGRNSGFAQLTESTDGVNFGDKAVNGAEQVRSGRAQVAEPELTIQQKQALGGEHALSAPAPGQTNTDWHTSLNDDRESARAALRSETALSLKEHDPLPNLGKEDEIKDLLDDALRSDSR